MPYEDDISPENHSVPRSHANGVASVEERQTLRYGDDGLDAPSPLAKVVGVATLPTEGEFLDEDLLKDLKANPPLAWLPGLLRSPIVFSLFLGMTGLLGIFLFNQVSSTLLWISTLGTIGQYLGYGFLGILVSAVGIAFLRLLWSFARLRNSPRWKLSGFQQLEKRAQLHQHYVRQQYSEVKEGLRIYLEEYPLANESMEGKKLSALGLDSQTRKQLQVRRDRLVDPSLMPSTMEWLSAFQGQFQAPIDEVAAARINHWAKRNALLVTLSNQSSFDTLGSLYFSVRMFHDLCTIYQLRSGRVESLVLLTRIFFQSYLAGQMNQLEPLASDQLGKILGNTIMGKIGGKAAEATANYFMMLSLGKHVQKLLMPVR
jgi:putative membrane protein